MAGRGLNRLGCSGRFLVGSLLAGTLGGSFLAVVVAVTSAPAGAAPTCYAGANNVSIGQVAPLGTVTVDPGSVPSPGSSTQSGTLQVCSQDSQVINGTVTASGNAGPGAGVYGVGGYVVADGSGNPNGPNGYIGVEGGNRPFDVVGCSKGDYTTGYNSSGVSQGNDDQYTDSSYAGNSPNPAPNDSSSGGSADSNGNNVDIPMSNPQNQDLTNTSGECSATNELPPGS
jgi:hypothetical protein